MGCIGVVDMSDIEIRIVGTDSDVRAFQKVIEADPQIGRLVVSSPRSARAADERLGHVELVEVVVKIGEAVAGRAAYEGLKAAFQVFRHRRRMRLECIGQDDVDRRAELR